MLFLREAMPYHRVLRLVLLTLCSILVPAVLAAEYPQGPVPTLWNEPPELPSGAGPFDAAATTARLSDATTFPPYTSELEPEDTTHLHRLDAGDGERLREGLPAARSRGSRGCPRGGFAPCGLVTSREGLKPHCWGGGGLPVLPARGNFSAEKPLLAELLLAPRWLQDPSSCPMTCHGRHLP
ncbi:protein SNORC isoform X1 [Corvus hawaiiensis]|uniref:protein SNORC isoform X1 n=1 Tax=Corvus hawaiiensis TaxID=134902 RepID=UPI0020196DA8|nr:protein SNORC isoform X1 [Corvus hawaiiensis]